MNRNTPSAAEKRDWLRRCDAEIQRQSEHVLARLLGTDGEAVLNYAGMWEDCHGRLPPRIRARLIHRTSGERGSEYALNLLLPVGTFHDPTKKECLFELCMLRAELHQELEGGGDGHVIARLEALFAQISSGRFEFRD